MPNIGWFPVPAYPKPLNIGPGDLIPALDSQDWYHTPELVRPRTALSIQKWYAPVILPQGAVTTKATLYGYREDAQAIFRCTLVRFDRETSSPNSIQLVADWTDGYGSIEGTTFNYPVIDNVNYTYVLMVEIDANDAVTDAWFTCFVLEWK